MSEEELEFLGHNLQYWIELQKRAESFDVVSLIEEIAELHGKVGYYERRLDEIEMFRKRFGGNK